MEVKEEGYIYKLSSFEQNSDLAESFQILSFIKKEPIGEGSSELRTVHNGTTNEDILAVLINRLEYLDNKFSSNENKMVIGHLKSALFQLEARTRDRKNRGVEGKHQV